MFVVMSVSFKAYNMKEINVLKIDLLPFYSRIYRPLVKHFNPNDENYGFDLSRVKMEPGTLLK